MSKLQKQADLVRSKESRIAEWEGQRIAMYKLHERDIANLIEMDRCVSLIAAHLGNLIQRIAGAYIPTESELEMDARGYDVWIRRGFEGMKISSDELFTNA